jgi:hypothetical protein
LKFNQEPTKIIKLFAVFAFADEKSLGFDPTVQRAEDDEKQFIITVHPENDMKNPRTFRTERIISSLAQNHFGVEVLAFSKPLKSAQMGWGKIRLLC